MTNDNLTYINPSTRLFPKRVNPLASFMVAPGFYYDPATGLVKEHPTSTSAPSTRRGRK